MENFSHDMRTSERKIKIKFKYEIVILSLFTRKKQIVIVQNIE